MYVPQEVMILEKFCVADGRPLAAHYFIISGRKKKFHDGVPELSCFFKSLIISFHKKYPKSTFLLSTRLS